MKTLSLDLRERIVAAYDDGEGTRGQIARRFKVSEGMVKKLLQQRRRTGDLAPRHRYSGRKPKITQQHRRALRQVVSEQPGSTLKELRDAVGLCCTIQAVHYVLEDMGLTYKKRRSGRVSRIVTTSP